LRCTVETEDRSVKQASITNLAQFQSWLQRAWEEFGWDLANFCLERCSDPITKLSSSFERLVDNSNQDEAPILRTDYESTDHTRQAVTFSHVSSSPRLDSWIPVESLNMSWEALWDPFEDPWLSSI
jgi:hypothetical protein